MCCAAQQGYPQQTPNYAAPGANNYNQAAPRSNYYGGSAAAGSQLGGGNYNAPGNYGLGGECLAWVKRCDTVQP